MKILQIQCKTGPGASRYPTPVLEGLRERGGDREGIIMQGAEAKIHKSSNC